MGLLLSLYAGGSLEMFMTDDQKKYYAAMKKMGNKKPVKATPRPRVSYSNFYVFVWASACRNLQLFVYNRTTTTANNDWNSSSVQKSSNFCPTITIEAVAKTNNFQMIGFFLRSADQSTQTTCPQKLRYYFRSKQSSNIKKYKNVSLIFFFSFLQWKPQAIVFGIVTNKKFDMIIMAFIGVNMLTMTLDHYDQTRMWSFALDNLNMGFIVVFTTECILKIFALRQYYFKEPWNVFDFVVVILSILGMW